MSKRGIDLWIAAGAGAAAASRHPIGDPMTPWAPGPLTESHCQVGCLAWHEVSEPLPATEKELYPAASSVMIVVVGKKVQGEQGPQNKRLIQCSDIET